MVQQKAYSLVLVSYISASHHDAADADSHKIGSVGDSRRKKKCWLVRSTEGATPTWPAPQPLGTLTLLGRCAPPKLVTLVNLVNSNLDLVITPWLVHS